MRLRQPAAVLAALTLTLPLAACSGQSVEDACAVAEKEVQSATNDLSSLNATDPAAAAQGLEKVGDALDRTEDKVDNEKVQHAIENLSDAFDALEDVFEELQAAGNDTAKVNALAPKAQTASGNVQKASEEISTLCKG